MRAIDLLVGRSWGQRIVVVGTAVVYAAMLAADPAAAVTSAQRALSTFVRLFTLILASLLLASALETLLPEETVTEHLGGESSIRNVVAAGLLGGALLGGPYATYPIMQSVRESGAGAPALLAMYFGYGAIGLGRLPFGLVIFSPTVVALRVGFAVALTVLAAATLWGWSPTVDDARTM